MSSVQKSIELYVSSTHNTPYGQAGSRGFSMISWKAVKHICVDIYNDTVIIGLYIRAHIMTFFIIPFLVFNYCLASIVYVFQV